MSNKIEYLCKGIFWTQDLTPEMIQFEKETGKNAIFNGKITGNFEYWMYWRRGKKKSPQKKKLEKPEKLSTRGSSKLLKNEKIYENIDNNEIHNFFIEYLNQHCYINKRGVMNSYIDKNKIKQYSINRFNGAFNFLIKKYYKMGVLIPWSKATYRIDKEKMRNIEKKLD